MIVELGQNIDLLVTLADGRDDRFLQAKIFQGSTEISAIALSNQGEGLYFASTPATAIGNFSIRYQVFKDAGFTDNDRKYQIEIKDLRVENFINELTDTIDNADGSAV